MTLQSPKTTDLHLPRWARRFTQRAPYKCAYGGRGSSKTWTVAHLLIAEAASRPLRIAVCRSVGASIAVSAKPALEIAIHRMGLGGCFDVYNWAIRGKKGTPAEGSFFFFRGIETNRQEIRGWEDVDRVWVEEAQYMTEATANILIPTIRKDGSEIWFTWNPISRTDWVWRRFVQNSLPTDVIEQVNWRDNPWFPERANDERLYMLKTNPEMYAHIWEGQPADEVGDLVVLPYRMLLDCVEAFKHGLHMGVSPWPLDAGLDIADQGADWNALVARKGPVIYHAEKWHENTLGATARRAASAAQHDGVKRLFYDAGGIGAGVTSYFREMPNRGFVIRPETFGDAVRGKNTTFAYKRTNAEFFARRNAQLAWALRLRAENTRRLMDGDAVDPARCLFIDNGIPRLEQYLAELAQPTWREGVTGKTELIKRDDDEPSPDLFDATSLAFAHDSENGLRLRS